MNIKEICSQSLNKNKYVLVHLSEQFPEEPGVQYDEIHPIYDNLGRLVFFAFVSEKHIDYYNYDKVDWFRIYDDKEDVEW